VCSSDLLGQWHISKSEYRISRLCRAGQRALEAILAGLPIPAHPERIISMLKLWDDFLSAYEHLCAAAAGKVPPPKAIKEYMDAWEKAKEAKEGAKTPTLLKRIAEGERALREATKSKHADTKRIDTKRVHQANMDLEALYRAIDVAPSAFSVRETTPQELEVVEVPAALAPDAGVKPAPADDPTAAIPAANTGAATPEEDGSTPPAETDLDDVGDGSTPATDAAAIAEQDSPVPGEAANPAAAPVEPAATDFEQGIVLELRGTQVLAVLTTMDKPLFDALRERMKDPAALYKFERKEMCRGAQKPGAWIRDFGDATQSTAAYQELVTWARYFGQPPA